MDAMDTTNAPAPAPVVEPVADDKNLLADANEATGCCGGSACCGSN